MITIHDYFEIYQFNNNVVFLIFRPRIKTKYVVILVILVLICIGLGTAHLMGAFSKKVGHLLSPPNPVTPIKPSASQLHIFNKAAVCADGIPCAKIGK